MVQIKRKILAIVAGIVLLLTGGVIGASPAGAEDYCIPEGNGVVCFGTSEPTDPPCTITVHNPPGLPPGDYCLYHP